VTETRQLIAQGEPVRATHKTASTKSRPSPSVCPGSPRLPRQLRAIACHCASVNIFRFRILFPFLRFSQSNVADCGLPRSERQQIHYPDQSTSVNHVLGRTNMVHFNATYPTGTRRKVQLPLQSNRIGRRCTPPSLAFLPGERKSLRRYE
jgi:hypothetical protein